MQITMHNQVTRSLRGYRDCCNWEVAFFRPNA
jgi:hypothetical protein